MSYKPFPWGTPFHLVHREITSMHVEPTASVNEALKLWLLAAEAARKLELICNATSLSCRTTHRRRMKGLGTDMLYCILIPLRVRRHFKSTQSSSDWSHLSCPETFLVMGVVSWRMTPPPPRGHGGSLNDEFKMNIKMMKSYALNIIVTRSQPNWNFGVFFQIYFGSMVPSAPVQFCSK